MAEQITEGTGSDSDDDLLRSISLFHLILVIVFTAGSWYIFNWQLAQSVLIGGVLASGSFLLLKRDVEQLVFRVAEAEEQGTGGKGLRRIEKVRFLMRFYARLIVLGLLLFVLANKVSINIIGLVIGLSTVMLSIVIVALGRGRKIFS